MRAITADRQDFSARLVFLALLAASVLILGAAFAFQLIGGLQPCELCIWQRYPYAITIGLTGVGIGLAQVGVERKLLVLLLALCALTFLTGAGIAAFHVGVEQKWWEGTSACVGRLSGAVSVDDLRERLLAAPVVRCDQPAWSLFGITMAGYNFLLSLALGVGSLLAAAKLRTGGKEP
jgi:disulfide bond formation protein DsbB